MGGGRVAAGTVGTAGGRVVAGTTGGSRVAAGTVGTGGGRVSTISATKAVALVAAAVRSVVVRTSGSSSGTNTVSTVAGANLATMGVSSAVSEISKGRNAATSVLVTVVG